MQIVKHIVSPQRMIDSNIVFQIYHSLFVYSLASATVVRSRVPLPLLLFRQDPGMFATEFNSYRSAVEVWLEILLCII